jgi:isopentenyldiphosphate isomerase
MRPQEPDPKDELFDVVDKNGSPTGHVKRRSDVPRDGDWHCAFHCWVTLRTDYGEPAILFQRRSLNKDTYPCKLDVAVGGHYRSGEGFEEVVREIEEELGIAPPNDALVPVGRRWAEGITDSWIDREIEDVYVYLLDFPVPKLRPSYEEITAVDVITARDIDALFSGDSHTVTSTRYLVSKENVPGEPFRAEVSLDDFIPVTDGYWPCGTRAAVQVLRGEREITLQLD